ncbi:MAG: hypothetical protein D6706_04000 [Chloroflexi bacterium]|nr:MAG: hypothetical protein D6706_04000 [Chloroflexota bacterium]
MDEITELVKLLRPVWQKETGGELDFVSVSEQVVPAEAFVADVSWEGERFGWLVGTAEFGAEAKRPLFHTWATLLGKIAYEQGMVEKSIIELMIAWDSLSLLHEVAQLMRTITDPWQLSLESLRLFAETVEVENAFVAQIIDEELNFSWINPTTVTRQTMERVTKVLQKQDLTLVLNDSDECHRTFPEATGWHSFMGKRLLVTAAPLSFIGLVNRVEREFNAGDRQLFENLAEQLTTAIDVESLYQQHIRTEQLNRDLALAAEVQHSFLPGQLPELAGYDLAAHLISATQIGGDFYDIFQNPGGEMNLLLCDVAGKGVAAALLAAHVRAVVRSELRLPGSPGEVLQRANQKLFEDMSHVERFATAVLVHVPPQGSHLTYASAGHTTALWLNASEPAIYPLPSTTLPLGIISEIDTESRAIHLQPNDVLLLYSDGLTEVANPAGELLGMDQVAALLLATAATPATFVQQSLLDLVRHHRGGAQTSDDLTLLVLKRVDTPQIKPEAMRYLYLDGDLRLLVKVEAALGELRPYLPQTDTAYTWLMQVQLAATEAVSNILRHAYGGKNGRIHACFLLTPHQLIIDFIDNGQPFQQPISPVPIDLDNPPEHGYGLYILHKVMDTIHYTRIQDTYNHWRLVRQRFDVPGG